MDNEDSDQTELMCMLIRVLAKKTCQVMCGSRGGGDRGSGPHLENHKNIGFLSNPGTDPLKNHKATKPAFNVGPSSAG